MSDHMCHTLVPVIMSGGCGLRLWPVSRQKSPKPFMRLPDGQNLLQKTFKRCSELGHVKDIVTVTNKVLYDLTRHTAQKTLDDKRYRNHYVLESVAKNTAPAILFAALYVREVIAENAVMLVCPADHLINDIDGLTETVMLAQAMASKHHIVTFGVQPDAPNTAYGYIQQGREIVKGHVYHVDQFIEKPALARAEDLLASKSALWNSGLFCLTAEDAIALCEQYAKSLYDDVIACWHASTRQQSIVTINHAYMQKIQAISFDHAIMEKCNDAVVVRAQFDWSDIGSWDAFAQIFPHDDDDNHISGDAHLQDCERCLVYQDSKRLVTGIGLHDLAIVDVDDALLIAHRDALQDVKSLVNQLDDQGLQVVKTSTYEERPWGSFQVLDSEIGYKVKRLVLNPGGMLSLQKHNRRREYWTIISGKGIVNLDDDEYEIGPCDTVEIAIGQVHRVRNHGFDPLLIIEVQTGDYLEEDDIVRYKDSYGRVEEVL